MSDTEGKIFISPSVPISDYGCIAHEIGHGAHEAFRVEDKKGEDFAEAIRYFVEEKHIRSDWFSKKSQQLKIHQYWSNVIGILYHSKICVCLKNFHF